MASHYATIRSHNGKLIVRRAGSTLRLRSFASHLPQDQKDRYYGWEPIAGNLRIGEYRSFGDGFVALLKTTKRTAKAEWRWRYTVFTAAGDKAIDHNVRDDAELHARFPQFEKALTMKPAGTIVRAGNEAALVNADWLL